MIAPFKSDLPVGRQRALALGGHYAAAVDQIRTRGLEAALEAVDCMGGVTHRRGIARGLVQLVAKAGAVDPYRIVDHPHNRSGDGAAVVTRLVLIPNLSWEYRGRQQVAKLEWVPMFGATDRRGSPPLCRPLPR